jgi:hypothetical protein
MKLSRKKIYKLAHKRCFFCPEDDPNLLDAHRIIPGKEGGKYINSNMLCICSNCHRKCHSGKIIVDRKYPSMTGKTVVHYFMEGQEFWREETF